MLNDLTPNTANYGKFYSMATQYGIPYTPNTVNSVQFIEIPTMNLNTIGVAGGIFSEVQGEFDTFIKGYKNSGFLFTYVTVTT